MVVIVHMFYLILRSMPFGLRRSMNGAGRRRMFWISRGIVERESGACLFE